MVTGSRGRSGHWKALAVIMMETDKQDEQVGSKSLLLKSWFRLWQIHLQNSCDGFSTHDNFSEWLSSPRHGGNQAGSKQPSSAWLEQPAWLDRTELQDKVHSMNAFCLFALYWKSDGINPQGCELLSHVHLEGSYCHQVAEVGRWRGDPCV